MIQQKKINVERILRVNRVGAWRIEIEDGKSPRFYADAVMDELLGIQGEISPEERFTFHRARVHPDDMQLFLEYSDKLSETKSEIVYRYIHPTFGEMFVRCSGIRDRSVVDGISIMGIHQDISETARMEKKRQNAVWQNLMIHSVKKRLNRKIITKNCWKCKVVVYLHIQFPGIRSFI